LNHVVFSLERTAVREVAVGGEFVVRDGRHPLSEEIVRKFAVVQRNVWGAA
jgi:cytosine/adenosine deaminase-related metal-dependent hydrolase